MGLGEWMHSVQGNFMSGKHLKAWQRGYICKIKYAWNRRNLLQENIKEAVTQMMKGTKWQEHQILWRSVLNMTYWKYRSSCTDEEQEFLSGLSLPAALPTCFFIPMCFGHEVPRQGQQGRKGSSRWEKCYLGMCLLHHLLHVLPWASADARRKHNIEHILTWAPFSYLCGGKKYI